jgi:hypothetical protein
VTSGTDDLESYLNWRLTKRFITFIIPPTGNTLLNMIFREKGMDKYYRKIG